MSISGKIKTLPELVVLVEGLKAQGKKIVTTNGCFDLVHAGHVQALEWTKTQGDILVVGLNTDNSVQKNKGELRPIISEQERAVVLAALGSVDYVFLFDEETPVGWIELLAPHVHVKSSDYTIEQIIEREAVEQNGGEVRLAPRFGGHSTSKIIEKISGRYPKSTP